MNQPIQITIETVPNPHHVVRADGTEAVLSHERRIVVQHPDFPRDMEIYTITSAFNSPSGQILALVPFFEKMALFAAERES